MKIFFNLLGCIAFMSGMVSCISERIEPEVDCTLSPIELTLLESDKAQCGESDGGFSVLASGPSGSFTYVLEDNSNIDGIFSGLPAGSYTVTAVSSNGCSEVLAVDVLNENGVNLTNIQKTDAECGSAIGSINVEAEGGVEPYQFSIDAGSSQASGAFDNLLPGTYSVSVSDAQGCESTSKVQVLSGISFEASISSIIENNCAVSGCHNGSVSPDFRSFGTIQANASDIKSLTQDRTMPDEGSLTQAEIDMIACWVDDGALDN